MTRSQIAQTVGIGKETVRYYEQRGLLPDVGRSPSDYRLYSDVDVQRLRFIQHAKTLGFTLREIKDLLDLRATSDADRQQVRERAQQKLDEVDAKLQRLTQMRDTLADLVNACDGHGALDGCPIIEAMETPTCH
ncbi:MAG: heavy metal-responsive transcriptional regulator [Bacteroidota bacterium]